LPKLILLLFWLHYHFNIYHDISNNQQHSLDTKFVIVCNLEGSLCGIFSLDAAIFKTMT